MGISIGGTHGERIDLLDAYAENYISQEIGAEALVKRLESFARFLEVAALTNAQITNVAGIARDAAVARPTVQGYFDTLTDTLIGTCLPAWRSRVKIKEVAHSKLHFFDPGVVRALTGRLREHLHESERGALLETYVLGEQRAWLNLAGASGQLAYWRTPSGSEVDFVWPRGRRAVGIEVKASARWRSQDSRALHVLTGSAAGGSHFGLVLLLREGIAAWLDRRSTCSDAAYAAADREQRVKAMLACDDLNAGIVRVLASMAMSGRGEMSP